MIKNDQPILDYEIAEVTFATLYNKHQRIKYGLDAIEKNEKEAVYFRKYGTIEVQTFVKPPTTREKPPFCKDDSNLWFKKFNLSNYLKSFIILEKSKGCQENCHEPCKYSLKDLNHTTKKISQKDIIDELVEHYHPSSRNMPTKKLRNTNESREELCQHYIYAHNLK